MGHGLLHQSNTPGRIGALLARSKDSHGRGEKVGVAETNAPRDVQRVQVNLLYLGFRRGTQVAQGRGLQNLHSWVRIPPAPPAFSFQISGFTTLVSFPPSPTWEHLGTTGKRASCPNSCPIPQQLPLRAMWIASHSSPSDSLSELQFTAGLARQIQFREDVRIEEAPRSGCSCKGVLLDFTTAESRRK